MSVFDLIHTIYFSPTGTTRKVAEAIAKGLKAPASEGSEPVVRSLDLTHRDAAEELLAGVNLHGRKVRLIGLTVGNTPEACTDCIQLRFDF